jgi:hypothetical protein
LLKKRAIQYSTEILGNSGKIPMKITKNISTNEHRDYIPFSLVLNGEEADIQGV